MTRFAWLQSRTQSLVVALVVAVLAVAAAITGVQLSHLYSSLVAHCTSGCDFAVNDFTSHDQFFMHLLDVVAQVAPALLGLFWGAPLLAREYETGTYRLAWTQSVSRSRWLLTRLALGALITVAVASVLTLTVTWWYRAVDHVQANQYAVFDRRSIVPIGYALFAFALGAFVGAVVRRTVPAMAVTIAVFVFARVGVGLWVRPHLLAAKRTSRSLLDAAGFGFESHNNGPLDLVARPPDLPNAWVQSAHLVTKSGHVATAADRAAFLHQYCSALPAPAFPRGGGGGKVLGGAPDVNAFRDCSAQAARVFHLVIAYQPAGRYWTFQSLETGLFVLLALVAFVGCYWRVVRGSD